MYIVRLKHTHPLNAPPRPLNDLVREARAGGASFEAIDKLSKDWGEKAGLMRFPEVCALRALSMLRDAARD